jgi:hypothetical protein
MADYFGSEIPDSLVKQKIAEKRKNHNRNEGKCMEYETLEIFENNQFRLSRGDRRSFAF